VTRVIWNTAMSLDGFIAASTDLRRQRPEAREAFGGAWSGPQFVLTHRPPSDEDDETITFLSGDIAGAVTTASDAAGGNDLLVLGAARGLIDEIIIFLIPVLLGGGVRLFAREGPPVDLSPLGVAQFGQVTHLRFALAAVAD
jgi:dihydrofolate reductase